MPTTVAIVTGPHGRTDLVEEEGRYTLVGAPPDRSALLMLARCIIDEATEEERAEIGAEDWY